MFTLMPRRFERRGERGPAQNLLSPLVNLRNELGPLFERFFGALPYPAASMEEMPWAFEAEEQEKEVIVRAELPGYEPKEIDVELVGDMLKIIAEHKEEVVPEAKGKEEKKTEERRWGRVVRSMTLPAGTEMAKVEARYHNGILEVHLPKTPEALPHRVEVKA